MSFLEFFHGLIENGTIPYGNYAFATGNGREAGGENATINSPDFTTKSIQKLLVNKPLEEGAYAHIISLNYTFEITFMNGRWELTRFWKCPVKRIGK